MTDDNQSPKPSHGHGHSHSHEHGHGHASDQGIRGALRYLRWAPQMWRSEVNYAVVELLAPNSSETVLDIGAGMGAGTVLAARKGAKVVAVEPTPFLRTVLTVRRLIQKGRKRISVVDGAAEKLPVDDASIDAVWSVNTMHHWVDSAKAADEIVRVLRPGGRGILVDEDFKDPNHPDFDRFGKDNHGDDNAEESHHGFTMVDADEMGRLLTSAGLSHVTATKKPLDGRPAIMVIGDT